MGKIISLSNVRARRRGEYPGTEEDAAKLRGYIAFKIAHQRAMDKRDGIDRSANEKIVAELQMADYSASSRNYLRLVKGVKLD